MISISFQILLILMTSSNFRENISRCISCSELNVESGFKLFSLCISVSNFNAFFLMDFCSRNIPGTSLKLYFSIDFSLDFVHFVFPECVGNIDSVTALFDWILIQKLVSI